MSTKALIQQEIDKVEEARLPALYGANKERTKGTGPFLGLDDDVLAGRDSRRCDW